MAAQDLAARLAALSRLLGRSATLEERAPDPEEDIVEQQHEASDPSPSKDIPRESSIQISIEVHGSNDAPQRDADAQPVVDLAHLVLDYSTFQVGEPIDANVAFCPWNLIVSYPSRFIGKTNKPLAQPFFDKILEGRVWDFFYIHDVSNPIDKPALVVPTVQFEDFLRSVNRQLAISLTIPGGTHLNKFSLKFGRGDTPRPRYLQRSRDQKALKVEQWPMMSDEDAMAFKGAPRACQTEWTATFKKIPTSVVLGKGTDSKRNAARKAEKRTAMLSEARHLVGACEQGITEDAVFVSVDIEAIERPPNPISEIGIATLDLDAVKEVPHGLYGEDWWPQIRAHHLRIKEYSGLVNREFVQGCPGEFDFGTSTFPPHAEVAEAVRAILSPFVEANRPLVLVGHDVKQDVQYLANLGIEVDKLAGMRSVIDSQAMHQVWRACDHGRSLRAVLGDLGIESRNLHNAGNDAVYTLRAAIGIAVRQHREAVVE